MVREIKACKLSDLYPGRMKLVEVDEDFSIIIANVNGGFYAIASECSHFGASLDKGLLHEGRIRCPWHQAVFDVVNGKAEEPPALDDLETFEVKLDGEDVIVVIPDKPLRQKEPQMTRLVRENDDRDFIIVGAGAAGALAAESLRKEGFQGRVIMITREDKPPYDRTELSKSYLKNMKQQLPQLRKKEFYDKHDIELWTETGVTEINTQTHTVHFQTLRDNVSGKVNYDSLLLAAGSVPRKLPIPGADLPAVHYLRSYDDYTDICRRAEQASSVAVIGASFIAMETAASLRSNDIDVTVIAPESVPFEYTLGKETGSVFLEEHKNNGVNFNLENKVTQIEPRGEKLKLTLDKAAPVTADFVIVGVGVEPAVSKIKGIKTSQNGSVTTDRYLRLAPDVFAAGDIAAFPDHKNSGMIRVEHWKHAQNMGAVAAANMMGKMYPYNRVPFFWTTQYELRLRYAGYAPQWDEIYIEGETAKRQFAAFYIDKARVTAVAGMNSDKTLDAAAELLQAGKMPAVDEIKAGRIELPEYIKELPLQKI